MRSRYRISLNNVHLDSLDSNLLIHDISYDPQDFKLNQDITNALDGFDYKREVFNKQTVTVTFELHIYDIAKRNEACQKVNAWAAAGGTLRTNDRADQQLMSVRCQTYASIGSVRDWTTPLKIVFSTTYIPYWVSREQKTLTFSGKSAKRNLNLDGNTGEALVSVDVTPTETVLKNFQINVGDKMLKLTDLAVAKGRILRIDYVRRRYLRIRAENSNGTFSSMMGKLDASSDDNLSAPCGEKTEVSIKAGSKVTCNVMARGLWV